MTAAVKGKSGPGWGSGFRVRGSAQPTNRQLRQLLIDLGFENRQSVEANCLVFEHPESKARLLLPLNKDDEPSREADIISIRTHLMYRRHLDQAGFEHFLSEGTPKAS
jgi:hypothetical protein